MNILIFVFSLLMMLTILTTSRLNSYLDFMVVRKEYLTYIQASERQFLKKRAQDLYGNQNRSSKRNGKESTPKTLNSRLDFSLFLRPDRDQDAKYETLYRVAVNLFNSLVPEERAVTGEQILNQLIDSSEKSLKEDEQLKKMELAVAESDPMRHEFCRLLAGFYDGNEPLAKYVTVERAAKISVYLAREKLLRAIFDEESVHNEKSIVREIIDKRTEIASTYRQKENQDDPDFKERAKQDLKDIVGEHAMAEYLNFSVSSTRPVN
jgi:hypothetical protein